MSPESIVKHIANDERARLADRAGHRWLVVRRLGKALTRRNAYLITIAPNRDLCHLASGA